MVPSKKRDQPKLNTVRVCGPGRYGCVYLSEEAKNEYDELCKRNDETSIREATNIKRYFENFSKTGPQGLHQKQMKSLGRFKDGQGKKVSVFEFKAYQWRLYGVCRHHYGRPAFIGLCVDAAKKKNKGDRKLMDRCAQLSVNL